MSLGLKETTEVLNALFTVGESLIATAKDTGPVFARIRHFADDTDELIAAARNVEEVPEELADLTPEESGALVSYIHTRILDLIERAK